MKPHGTDSKSAAQPAQLLVARLNINQSVRPSSYMFILRIIIMPHVPSFPLSSRAKNCTSAPLSALKKLPCWWNSICSQCAGHEGHEMRPLLPTHAVISVKTNNCVRQVSLSQGLDSPDDEKKN